MNQAITFEKPPVLIDLVIHHPIIAACISSKYFYALLAVVLLTSLFYLIRYRARKPIARILAATGSVTLILLITGIIVSPHIVKARTPTSSTIIAGMVDSKTVISVGPWKYYYFIVDVNRRKYGVRTTKAIYELPQYVTHATLDYSLYTYVWDNEISLYRFCDPDLKLKAERGNLQ